MTASSPGNRVVTFTYDNLQISVKPKGFLPPDVLPQNATFQAKYGQATLFSGSFHIDNTHDISFDLNHVLGSHAHSHFRLQGQAATGFFTALDTAYHLPVIPPGPIVPPIIASPTNG